MFEDENKVIEQNEPVQEEPIIHVTQPEDYTVDKQPKKKKKIIVFCAIGVVLIAVIVVALLLFGQGGAANSVKNYAVNARMSDDGSAYIPLYDGTIITINEDVEAATLTADRKHIVVLLKDGTLYVTDRGLTGKNSIADNCATFGSVRDDGFFYADEEFEIYRVLFSDYSSICLGEVDDIVVAENNTTALYSTYDGKIFTLTDDTSDGIKISTYSGTVELEAISDDGKISVWVTKDDNSHTIILNDGDNKTTLGKVDSEYNYTYVTFSKDQKIVVITNWYSENVWVKKADEDPITVRLGSTTASSVVYTSNGLLSEENAAKITSFYVSTDSDSGTNIYRITMDGDRERVLSKVSDYVISNGKILYIDEDQTLYCADIKASQVSNEMKISSDVHILELTDNGKFLYFAKDCEDYLCTLYCYKVGDDASTKISSDVACYTLSYGNYVWLYTEYSTDGSTVYFFKDREMIGDTYSACGTLMTWKYGKEGTNKISSDVMVYSVSSALDSGEVKPSSFMFMKYNFVDIDDNIFVNWMYFDGTESHRLVTDVIY